MTLSAEQKNRLDLLLTQLTDGALSPAESEELGGLLRGNAEARALYMQSMLVAVRTREYFREHAAETAVSRRQPEPAPRAATPTARRRGPLPFSAHARRRGWRVTGLAAAVLVGFGIVLSYQMSRVRLDSAAAHGPALATLLRATGPVRLQRGAQIMPAKTRAALRDGDRILTAGLGSSVVIASPAIAELELGPGAAATLAGEPHGGLGGVSVERGALRAAVQPRKGLPPFAVSTPHAEVVVIGTRFSVDVTDAATRVQVAEGVVRLTVRRSGESVALSAGQSAEAGERLAGAARAHTDRYGRTRTGLVALYTFREGRGTTVRDTAGVREPLDLQIADRNAVEWLPGGGLRITRPTVIASAGPARKLIEACRTTNELTVEAWLKPAIADQFQRGAVRIVTVSSGSGARNFTLGQSHASYELRLRTSETTPNGHPSTATLPGTLACDLTHVVFTRDAAGRCRCFLNGAPAPIASADRAGDQRGPAPERTVGGNFADWDATMRLGLANELGLDHLGLDRHWFGELQLVAVYARALSPEEVRQNRDAGPAQLTAARTAPYGP
ncbi:MAG: FecR domain-containing protein [Kiritimatiellae bacterium]|nr:FecR domain-containing protein [Kiritimatiellia bacterium]